jgi:flagellar M-ring protein FliF
MAEAAEKKTSSGFAVLDGLGGLGVIKQIGLMIGLAASIALGFGVILWSQEPDFTPLYTDISHLEAGQVADLLQRENIRFKVDTASGMLLVESNRIHDARMKLAAEGFPTGASLGYELLDKEQAFGTSQFMEKTRYHRSLEGELAKTISSMNRVRGARVHLAMPKRSVFISDNRKPSASVFVELYPGQSLERMQVAAIVQLVAASIPELSEKQVTVVDQRGQLLSDSDHDSELALATKQLDYSKKIEDRYVARISGILQSIVGDDGYRVQVSADVDFSQTEQTSESFNPDLPAVRSEQTLSEIVGAGGAAAGVPGALSSQPPGAVTVPETAAGGANAAQAEGATAGNTRQQATRNFELDRTISHTRHQVGAVKRLTVAVVLDDKPVLVAGADNKQEFTRQPLSDAELERIRVLIKDAIGFNAARGDSVTVINQSFRIPQPSDVVEIPPPPIWEQPWFWDLVKRGGGFLLVIFLIFGVLRPILKRLADVGKDDALAALESQLGGSLGMEGALAGGPEVTLSGASNPLLPGPNASYDQHLDAVKSMVAEDPRRVAQVVKTWIANE